MKSQEIKDAVKRRFSAVVRPSGGCACSGSSVVQDPEFVRNASRLAGYSNEQLARVPTGANLGLGCGNPLALAQINEGDVVLDLGSGAGIDCFLAADIVGPTGRVIGVDMTSAMVDKARENARRNNYDNVEFRQGEIEQLPVDDASVDVIISNCVINLSPSKPRVFSEAFRVLRPGGRLLVSDMVLLEELPEYLRDSVDAYVRCIGGAALKDEYLLAMKEAGFRDVTIMGETAFPAELIKDQPVMKELIKSLNIPMSEVERLSSKVVSLKVAAMKNGV